jgi:hypothetical protein
MQKLIVKKPFTYAGKARKVGDEIVATGRNARLLTLIGKAAPAPENPAKVEKAAPPKAAPEVKTAEPEVKESAMTTANEPDAKSEEEQQPAAKKPAAASPPRSRHRRKDMRAE